MLRKWVCEVVSSEEEGISWGKLHCMAHNRLDAETKLGSMLRSQSIPDAVISGVRRARHKDEKSVVVQLNQKVA